MRGHSIEFMLRNVERDIRALSAKAAKRSGVFKLRHKYSVDDLTGDACYLRLKADLAELAERRSEIDDIVTEGRVRLAMDRISDALQEISGRSPTIYERIIRLVRRALPWITVIPKLIEYQPFTSQLPTRDQRNHFE